MFVSGGDGGGGAEVFGDGGAGVGAGAFLHEADEGAGPVSGVEGDEGETACEDAFDDAFDAGDIDGLVLDVAPPDDDVGLIESGGVEALFRGFEVGGFDGEAWEGGEVSGDGFAEEFVAVGFFLFGLLFIPDEDADGVSGGGWVG